jgi:hypothetical protein
MWVDMAMRSSMVALAASTLLLATARASMFQTLSGMPACW